MPRPKRDPDDPVREVTGIRMKPASLLWFDQIAAEMGLYRSEVMRACFTVARRHEAELHSVCTQLAAMKDGDPG